MLKIVKNEVVDKKKRIIIQTGAIIAALLATGLIILILGFNPVEFFGRMVNGAIGDAIKIKQSIVGAIPLIITSMGILVAFKMKFWNIGGEGQIMMGGFGAALVALNMGPEQSPFVVIPLMIISGAICGMIWAMIPAFFKGRLGTNETIFTLMLNYIAINFVTYLQNGPWIDPEGNGFPKIATFNSNAILPNIEGIHLGLIFAILSVIFIYILINNTKKGYEITVVGESLATAKYAGIKINSVTMFAMAVSGGLCGLAGMVQASAVEMSLSAGLSAGVGFTAIITAWIGKLNPPLVMIVCLFFSMLIQGGSYVEISMQVPAAVSEMTQGLILFFVLAGEFFLNYKVVKSENGKEHDKKLAKVAEGGQQ